MIFHVPMCSEKFFGVEDKGQCKYVLQSNLHEQKTKQGIAGIWLEEHHCQIVRLLSCTERCVSVHIYSNHSMQVSYITHAISISLAYLCG